MGWGCGFGGEAPPPPPPPYPLPMTLWCEALQVRVSRPGHHGHDECSTKYTRRHWHVGGRACVHVCCVHLRVVVCPPVYGMVGDCALSCVFPASCVVDLCSASASSLRLLRCVVAPRQRHCEPEITTGDPAQDEAGSVASYPVWESHDVALLFSPTRPSASPCVPQQSCVACELGYGVMVSMPAPLSPLPPNPPPFCSHPPTPQLPPECRYRRVHLRWADCGR